MVSVKRIKTSATYFLRKEILRRGIDLPYQFEEDNFETTFHLGVFKNKELLCVATFIMNSTETLVGKQYQLRGMATSLTSRGKGFGKLLLTYATKELENRKIEYLWCNARTEAINFYEKNQFQIMGEQFLVEKVGSHYKMFKTIKNENQ